MGFVGLLIGAALILFLLSRVIGFVLLRNAEPPQKQVVSTLAAWLVVTVIGGLGNPEGGTPTFIQAGIAFGIPAVLVALIDSGIALSKKNQDTTRPPDGD